MKQTFYSYIFPFSDISLEDKHVSDIPVSAVPAHVEPPCGSVFHCRQQLEKNPKHLIATSSSRLLE